jgi:hypothetical protein
VTLQSFMLLRSVDVAAQVELLFYTDSPTELHSLASRDEYDVVEIYPNSGKFHYHAEGFR